LKRAVVLLPLALFATVAHAQIITLPSCGGYFSGTCRVTLSRTISGSLYSGGNCSYRDSAGAIAGDVSLAIDQYIHPDGATYNALASTQSTVMPANYSGSVSMTPYPACFRAHMNGDAWGTGCRSHQEWGSSAVCVDKTSEVSLYCPLVLDLNGDGIHTTSVTSPIFFWDHDFDGVRDASGWTDPDTEEAFLWIDDDDDRAVAPGELFGSVMFRPAGGFFPNGFQALEQFDMPDLGGNADHEITAADAVWPRLRLWVDRNHDGRSHPNEISRLEAHQIVALKLERVHDHHVDANGNGVMLVGSYVRSHGGELQELAMDDISFAHP